MASPIRRPIASSHPNPRYNEWLDMLGIDSEYDYDPVWAKCVEWGLADLSFGDQGRWHPALAFECGIQSHWSFRGSGRGSLQSAVFGGRDAALPDAQLRVFGRRSGMGVRSLQRSDRALEEA